MEVKLRWKFPLIMRCVKFNDENSLIKVNEIKRIIHSSKSIPFACWISIMICHLNPTLIVTLQTSCEWIQLQIVTKCCEVASTMFSENLIALDRLATKNNRRKIIRNVAEDNLITALIRWLIFNKKLNRQSGNKNAII